MYPMFKKTVETLISKVAGVSLKDFYREKNKKVVIQKSNFDDLIIEKNGDQIKVGYYRKGDHKPDPMFTFQLSPQGNWYPLLLEQVLGKSIIGEIVLNGYVHSPGRFRDAKTFANTCAREWKFYYL